MMLNADLDTLKKYYDVARIIEPAHGCADGSRVAVSEPIRKQGDDVCRHFGHKGRACHSCLCLQAIENNETFVKTEVLDGNIYMVTAMPLKKDGRIVALELIKLISERTIGFLTELPQENTRLYHSIAKLHEWATKDALTEIYNRRFIDERLPKAIKEARQQCEPFSIVMADIDWFKLINDRYGHGVGDEILKRFAAMIENNIRSESGDWVARYGGEEFLIFLDNCSEKCAYKITEKLRRIIEQTQLFTKAGVLHITASFGIHTFGERDEVLQQLMERADQNLYQAKQSGRNCTVAENYPKRPEPLCRENCKYAK